jgi:uncharacterized protein (DUF2147 family)
LKKIGSANVPISTNVQIIEHLILEFIEMKSFKALCIAACSFLLTASFVSYGAATSIEGEWLTPSKGRVLIYKAASGTFEARVLGGEMRKDKNGNSIDKDINNPNVALRNRLLIGLVIMKNTIANDSGEWSGGTIYDPNNGNEYSCKIWLDDANTLNIRGFIGISLFGRTERCTRIVK